jgi:hypothetical protein
VPSCGGDKCSEKVWSVRLHRRKVKGGEETEKNMTVMVQLIYLSK